MKIILVVLLLAFSQCPLPAQPNGQAPTVNTNRYFGLHFDFHAEGGDSLVGRNLSERQLDSLLTAVKPDFIQVDCKGHPGVSSYPSKVATATVTPRIEKDPLAFYRAVTRKHGVALYLHYSGVFDYAALANHPDWAVQQADGSKHPSMTSVHGPYADSLLIPQLRELADYGADGVWVDGECWATLADYSEPALAKFRAATGVKTVPRSESDPGYGAFQEFARQSFVDYLGHYVDDVHRHKPTFRIASNWAYSSMMPAPITTQVDYLSGDLTPGNSVNSAALEGRIMAAQGQLYRKPWDLMSWGFWYTFGPARQGDQKTAVHLMQDAAEILALGGGFQTYYQQRRDASLPLRQLPVMAELSQFVRARQPFCEGSVAVPQVALVYANATVRAFSKSLFGNEQTGRVNGVLTALLDAQLPVEVLSEQHLQGRMKQYPVIVLSQQDSLDPGFRRELLDYARQGGNVLIIGAENTRQFAAELGVTPVGANRDDPTTVLYKGESVLLTGAVLPVRITGGATRPIGQFLRAEAGDPIPGVVASETPYGQGRLTAVYADLSADYRKHQSPKLRDFMAALVQPLLSRPRVAVSGSHLVHVVLNRQNNKLAVNLINTGGRHADPQVYTHDEVPPLTNLTVQLRTDSKPKRVIQQPENRRLPVRYANGVATITVPQLALHSILVVE
ncbi:alpha-amylase family protein [Spirosoma rigui]|uniref:alpha-amylase family protein n=1 Tax=Spirosoma rigui TaxID=564064 RepID=UPI0009AF32C1|nr:alpha-amylase family protein [Spirosoma rigui]